MPTSSKTITTALARPFFLCLACLILPVTQSAKAQDQETYFFYIQEYRVAGSTKLTPLEIEQAVYPFLGPARTAEDVEQARNALEKSYRDKGYQTVSVLIPQQDPSTGIIRLEALEGTVSKLTVKGARYHLPSQIRAAAPSLAEGSVPNMDDVRREILALNRLGDRRVTPELRPGTEQGTFEVDLNVDDKLPLHGNLELNNRFSPNTSELRFSGSLSYANLFQLGHTLGTSFQIAPENTDDALVYSAYYLARVSEKTSLMFTATRQDSDVSTLGGGSVVGRGNILGARALIDLPSGDGFFQSFSIGIDRKHFEEDIKVGGGTISAPIEYYPISANYNATWLHGKTAFTEANASLLFNLRGMGSDSRSYANKRFKADGSFIVLKADASHTRDFENDSQLFAKIQGQIASKALINSEQFSGGGLSTARGYLESTALGDNALFLTTEYRSPSYIGTKNEDGKQTDDLRFHAFIDAGILGSYDSLPGQKSTNTLLSAGIGTRFQIHKHYHGSLDLAVPLTNVSPVDRGDIRITYRAWANF